MSNERWETSVARHRGLVAPWRREAPVVANEAPVDRAVAHEGWEREAIAILVRPIENESAAAAHARKEDELKAVFARLSIPDARALHARLVSAHDGDELAQRIARLVPARRARLVAFVADARRRAAVEAEAAARRCG